MFSAGLISIKQSILSANPYLNTGYHKAHYAEKKGIFVDKERVFPMDTKGNYFYLRIADRVNTVQSEIQVDMVIPVTCVVCVRDADAETLAYNIMQTLLGSCQSIAITSVQLLRDDVVRTELRGAVSDETVNKALSNMGDWTIISVSFNYAYGEIAKPLTCIENPCVC